MPVFKPLDDSTSTSDLLDLSILSIDDGRPLASSINKAPPAVQSRSPHSSSNPTASNTGGPFVLAIDYGTTRTGVSWAVNSGRKVQRNWGPGQENEPKIRSAISYINPIKGEEQWGLTIDASRVAMVNTKLELEPQDTRFDELDLTLHALKGVAFLRTDHMISQGPSPEYSPKAPGEIITDYLRHVFKQTSAEMQTSGGMKALAATRTPMDLVITMPVGWSYEAQDTIFKAVRRAGFNRQSFPTLRDTIFVSEPEAASYFTAQQVRDNDADCFQENDCFVLCDAGGGTVDVVSFQVKRLKPDLVLEMITEPTGAKCGSALIDTEFKSWLRDAIGEHNYAEIDPVNGSQHRISPYAAEGGDMRTLIEQFNLKKHEFSHTTRSDIEIELPQPLKSLTINDRVNQGLLTIRRAEMKRLMDHCVNGVLKLIKEQVEKVIAAKGQRVWNVLLVGGFGASPYLQAELKKSLGKKRPPIGVHVPKGEDQATAVVQGAVIYGIEKGRHKNATYLSAIARSYAVVINGNFMWFLRKGDMTSSTSERVITSDPFKYSGYRSDGKYEFPIYTYKQRNAEDDFVPMTWAEGENEVKEVTRVKCDFSKDSTPNTNFTNPSRGSSGNRSITKMGLLQWRFTISDTDMVEAEILQDQEPVGASRWKCAVDPEERSHKSPATLGLKDGK